ncbi:MAG: hypothetical protein WCJ95_19450 [Mariniphaga sp.]
MLEKFDEFTSKEQRIKNEIDNQKKQNRLRISALKKKKMDLGIERIKNASQNLWQDLARFKKLKG